MVNTIKISISFYVLDGGQYHTLLLSRHQLSPVNFIQYFGVKKINVLSQKYFNWKYWTLNESCVLTEICGEKLKSFDAVFEYLS